MRVKVFVTPRKGILDPQGRAVEHSLHSLGFQSASDVKIGKYIVLDVDAQSADAARAEVKRMCDQLLTNPIIEDYSFEVEGSPPEAPRRDGE